MFPPTEISEWVNEGNAASVTALCPHCGIDSVIPEQPDRLVNSELLAAMHAYWFGRSISIHSNPSLMKRLQLRLEPILRRVSWDWRGSKKDAI